MSTENFPGFQWIKKSKDMFKLDIEIEEITTYR